MFLASPVLITALFTAKEATQFFIKGVTAGTAVANVVKKKR